MPTPRRGSFGDWQSPVMAALWRLIDPIAPGSLSMFLLTATLYWLGFGLLALIAVRRVAWLGLVTPLLAFAPPAFFFVGMVWRDILFGVVWLVAAVLALAGAERAGALAASHPGRSRCSWSRSACCCGRMRFSPRRFSPPMYSGPCASTSGAWPSCFCPPWFCRTRSFRSVYYGLLDAKRQNPLHSILVFDLGGITHFTGENQFPVTWSAEQTALLTSKCYDPVRWDSYWHVPPCPFVMQRLERPDDIDLRHAAPGCMPGGRRSPPIPSPICSHRATFMWHFLARLESRTAGLGLARSRVELWPQPHLYAAGRAARQCCSPRCCSGPACGWSSPWRSDALGRGARDRRRRGRSP